MSSLFFSSGGGDGREEDQVVLVRKTGFVIRPLCCVGWNEKTEPEKRFSMMVEQKIVNKTCDDDCLADHFTATYYV